MKHSSDPSARTVSSGSHPAQPDEIESFDDEDLAGREIAACRILSKLGQGAMGAVYLSEQISLRRTVALKILDPKFSRDLTYIERFEREAQAAARLTHFNIVQVFDYGREEDLYFIVNEYVDGGNVQELIDAEGVLEPKHALDLALQATQGLMVAQAQSIVHRDIKPENLMVTSDGVVKIADFGLAKVVSDDATVTQSGMIVGTPFYMSPEQAKGLELDPRSDIYSLGVSFFHMLTGQIPFDADSVIGVLLKQISAERPDPCAVNPSLPVCFSSVVMRMMARSVEDRYQTAADVKEELERIGRELETGITEPSSVASEAVADDRRSRYKLLSANQILHIEKRGISSDVKMKESLKADAGIFIRTNSPFEKNTIVELTFLIPGKAGRYKGIGIVRWTSHDGESSGMGVTMLKVAAVPQGSTSRRDGARAQSTVATPAILPSLKGVEAIKALTRTQLHSRMLRYVYANTGQSVELTQIASALGCGLRMLDEPLAVLERTGMMKRHRNGVIDLLWPADDDLQKELVAWVSRYGLL